MLSEIWRQVPGFPRYEASNLGRVRSISYVDGKGHTRKPRFLTPQFHNGYYSVGLTKEVGSGQTKVPLGRVILESFDYFPAAGEIVLHGPRGRDCNELSNLSFGTYAKNNGEDRRRDGTLLANCDHPRTHLSIEDVKNIRKLRGQMSQKDIANLYSIDQTTVSNIQLRKSFKGVS